MRFPTDSSSGNGLRRILKGEDHQLGFQTPNTEPSWGYRPVIYQYKVGRLGLHRINYESLSLLPLCFCFLSCNHHLHPNERNQWEREEWWVMTINISKLQVWDKCQRDVRLTQFSTFLQHFSHIITHRSPLDLSSTCNLGCESAETL